ncbi:hypothetical protein DFP91_5879 [Pseudorhodoplanes sinuspersici]|uniref:Uncharacterized protein n=1 Tax=Pseudorhodoplanes sinuspersici TaxID=1235591 RepID=A0A1W6ZRX1_9HYPH|nr:hypothetical protein CAK95_14395 [Pseudorhodoplanes sinuspersici]RKE65659.1 hypothetical protein DFP91_5879 [Pseudorhodoplanes sinuspersici]
MHHAPRTRRSEGEISELLNEALKKTVVCRGVPFGPIIQRDTPGDGTAHLQDNPSGSCQRAFIAIRSQLQSGISIAPFEKGYY